MTHTFFQTSVEIHAPASKVWRIFTDPSVSKRMGGEYVSDWRVGSTFGWKSLDGTMLTHGTIIQIVPEKLLKHTLFTTDTASVLSVITYELIEKDSHTVLTCREEFTDPIDDKQYGDAAAGWGAALAAVKELAEI